MTRSPSWIPFLLAAVVAAQSAPSSRPPRTAEAVGRVTDLAGAAIPGATLLLLAETAGAATEPTGPGAAVSGEDGRFVLRVPLHPEPDAARPVLRVAAPGRASARIELPAPGLDEGAAAVDLGTVALAPGRVVRGVVQAQGRPLANARVRARDALTPHHLRSACWAESALTGDNGVFTLPGVVAGPLSLEISADGHATRSLTPVHGNDLVQVELAATGYVSGRVRKAPKGPPFSGHVRLVSEWSEDGPLVRLAEDGSFRLPIPWVGRFCAVALAGGTTWGHSRVLDGPAADVEIVGAAPEGLRIRARDAVTGARIRDFRARWFVATGRNPETGIPRGAPAPDPEGVLLLPRPAAVAVPLAMRLLVEARGYERAVVDLLPEAPEQLVDLARSPGVAGRVVGPDQKPRAGVVVSARTAAARGVADPIAQVLTDADGRFVMDGIGSGRLWLLATGPAGIPGAPTEVMLAPAAERPLWRVLLPDETVVRGTASGAPPGSRLAILPDHAWELLRWQHRRGRVTSLVPPTHWSAVAADGGFEARTVVSGAGHQVVALWTPGAAAEEAGTFTEAARHRGPPLQGRVAIELAALPATLRGRVVWNGPKERLRDVALVAAPATGDADALLDARVIALSGERYRLRLPPGAWALGFRDLASQAPLPCVPDRIELTSGAEREVDLTLKAAIVDLTIEGPDRQRPCVESLLVLGTTPGLLEGPVRLAARPVLDLRGAVRAVRFLAPEGRCLLRTLPGAGRLAPQKAGRGDRFVLAELELAGLQSGAVRSETLTLAPPLPIVE